MTRVAQALVRAQMGLVSAVHVSICNRFEFRRVDCKKIEFVRLIQFKLGNLQIYELYFSCGIYMWLNHSRKLNILEKSNNRFYRQLRANCLPSLR